MQTVFLGEEIRRKRKERKMTQGQLCEGICEISTISRLENGTQTPSRNVLNALLERLGMPGDRYYALVSKHEMEVSSLHQELVSIHNRFERCNDVHERIVLRQKAIVIHESLRNIMDDDDRISKQVILRSEVFIGKSDGTPYSPKEQLEMSLEALKITVPDFDENDIYSGFYTKMEIKIICQIAIAHARSGDLITALNMFRQLLKNIQKRFPPAMQIEVNILMVIANYALTLGKLQSYQEAYDMAEEGRQLCIQYMRYHFLPDFISMQAECSHYLGNDDKSHELFIQSYYLHTAFQDAEGVRIDKINLKTYFDEEVN